MSNKNSFAFYSLWEELHNPDIAFEFASWLSPEFKLYLITEFERLKVDEAYRNQIQWHANRILTKANYLVHTDAIKNYIVPELTEHQKKFIYAEEADVLNVALFGMTAKEWTIKNVFFSLFQKMENIGNVMGIERLLTWLQMIPKGLFVVILKSLRLMMYMHTKHGLYAIKQKIITFIVLAIKKENALLLLQLHNFVIMTIKVNVCSAIRV